MCSVCMPCLGSTLPSLHIGDGRSKKVEGLGLGALSVIYEFRHRSVYTSLKVSFDLSH